MTSPPSLDPVRNRRASDGDAPKPIYAVWELTMKCDQPCQHCGSRAGHAREVELSTEEVLATAHALADLGCREVVLIGGEAYLRTDLPIVVETLAKRGLRVGIQTGGRAFTSERAKMLRGAGLTALGVSIDGPEDVHDELRGNVGSHAAALRAMDAARDAGLVISSNTQINRLNFRRLREVAADIRAHGAIAWQVQLTVPMGRAADRADWIVAPWHVVEILDTLAEIQIEAAKSAKPGEIVFDVVAGNNLGYFGPHEAILRSRPGRVETHWSGCKAGRDVIGIESDGTIKACPSLPTAPYDGGNVKDSALAEIWSHAPEVRFARDRSTDELWGFCKSCYYADVCMAGCSWTAHCTLGRRGNNPFCYHRVTELKKKGMRERLVVKELAPQLPYDFGRLEIVEEAWQDELEEQPAPRRRLPVAP